MPTQKYVENLSRTVNIYWFSVQISLKLGSSVDTNIIQLKSFKTNKKSKIRNREPNNFAGENTYSSLALTSPRLKWHNRIASIFNDLAKLLNKKGIYSQLKNIRVGVFGANTIKIMCS